MIVDDLLIMMDDDGQWIVYLLETSCFQGARF